MPKTYIRYDKILIIKLSKKLKDRVSMRAMMLCGGNLSRYVRYCIENAPPAYLDKKGRITRPKKDEL